MRQTRYFLLCASAVLVLGLCTGLFAYFSRGSALAVSVSGPLELAYVPAGAPVVGYANVREVMLSNFRERIRQVAPDGVGQDALQEYLGLDIERDIDHVLAFMAPGAEGTPAGLVMFRGRFDVTRLEAAARRAGGTVSTYGDTRIVSAEAAEVGSLAMAFMQPGLVAVGDLPTVQQAVDRGDGGASLVDNAEMAALLEQVEDGSNAWAVGRFGDLNLLDVIPDDVLSRMPAVSSFVVSGRINGGLTGALMIEGRDEEAGQNLRDVFRGLMALAKMQTAAQPGLQTMLDSLRLGGTGVLVTMSFWLPPEALDFIFSGPVSGPAN